MTSPLGPDGQSPRRRLLGRTTVAARGRTRRRGRYAAALAATALLLTACGQGISTSGSGAGGTVGASTRSTPASSSGAQKSLSGTVTVLAAASLTEPLTELAHDFEQAHPGVSVETSFGSSTTLAQQIAAGAPADLYASAGETALKQVPADLRPASRLSTIARNVLEIATPPGDPAHVSSIRDLSHGDVAVVLCVATAPCGQAADTVLARAGVRAHVVSREIDVKATLAKVRLGEVDAAVVYHSDVVSAGDAVHGVPIPDAVNQTLTYPLLRLGDSAAARAYATYLASPAGVHVLEQHGFLPP